MQRFLDLILPTMVAAPFILRGQTDRDRLAQEEIRRLNKEESEALLCRDMVALARLWSNDMVVTNPLNKFVRKQQVLEMVKSGFLVIVCYKREIEYLQVHGDTAIVAGSESVTWGGEMPNAGKLEHMRFTGIWMRKGAQWQEVARHANLLPEQ